MEEFNPLEVDIIQLKDDLQKKSKVTLNKYTIQKLSSIIEANGLSKKALGTLTKMSKTDLKELILNGDKEPEKGKTQIKEDKKTASSFIETANSLKKTLHQGEEINPFIKEQGEKAFNNVVNKLNEQDESIVDKMGNVGTVLSLFALGIDVLFSTAKLADKGQKKLEAIKEKKNKPTEQEQKENDTNK